MHRLATVKGKGECTCKYTSTTSCGLCQ